MYHATHYTANERCHAAMFGKVDDELGDKIRKVTETKIENNHAHPHKTAWH